MDARYATLFGYTREETLANFPEHIAALAGAQGLTPEGAFAKMEERYDGFRFEESAERVFNPVSVGRCLTEKQFGNYWFETRTPTFLVEQLKRNPIEPSEVKTAQGRIDAVVETPKFVFRFEFKLRGTSEEALAQIEEKGYAAKYASDPRKLFKIGCAFDWNVRNLGKWIVG